jgi:uncharacterized protein YllA (UPF0747 family)
MPVAVSRAGFTLVESRAVKLLNRYRLTLPETFVDPEPLKERIARALVPDSVDQAFAGTAAGVARSLDGLRSELESFDHTLASALEKSRSKILYQIDKTRRKIARETMRRDERATADAAYLTGLLYPQKHLQERFYSILPFLANHGLSLVDRLFEAVQLECPDHRVLDV